MKKTQIITVAEIKGGTGKTTTAATIAQAGRCNGKKVLVIDLDAQGAITYRFGADPAKVGSYGMLCGACKASEAIQHTEQGIDLIAGAPDLYTISFSRGGINTLSDAIEPIKKSYDLIIIDTPPALNDLTFNALQAANGLLIALYADESSADGLLLTLNYAQQIRNTNSKLKVLGCLITRYDGRPKINNKLRNLCADAAKANKCPYLGEIRQGVAIQEAAAYGYNLFEYAPKSKPAVDYMNIYNQIIK